MDEQSLFDQLEEGFTDVLAEMEHELMLEDMSTEELLEEHAEARNGVRGVVLSPQTREHRDAHSRYYGVMIELKKRGM